MTPNIDRLLADVSSMLEEHQHTMEQLSQNGHLATIDIDVDDDNVIGPFREIAFRLNVPLHDVLSCVLTKVLKSTKSE